MASVAIREFSNGQRLDRTLARHQSRSRRFGDPLKILLQLEAEAEEAYDPRLPASRSAFLRYYINQRLNHYTR